MSILEELAKIVGNNNVSEADEILRQYAKDESFVHPIMPRCVVKPINTDQVQQIVIWANKTHTPLVPISSGPPHFRGDTVPSVGESVIVDLSLMKRIIRVDPKHRVAMVEPGVTFGELIPEIEKAGLRLNMPLLPRASKSVVGSLLEREPVIMPKYHWDISDPLACLEVVYGTGELFRTGSAAGPGSIEEQWKANAAQNEATGPLQADFHRLIQCAQGTMGIVTWATLRCEHAATIEEPFLVGATRPDALLTFAQTLIRNRLVDDCLILNASDFAGILSNKLGLNYRNLKDTLPLWNLFFNISGLKYFPEDRVKYQIEAMKEMAKPMNLLPVKALGKASAFEILKILSQPSNQPYWKIGDKGSCFDISFLSVYENLPDLVKTMHELIGKYDFPSGDLGIYIQPMVQGVNYHCEFNLFFDPNNANEKQKLIRLSEESFEALSAKGAFFSRPYGSFADMAFQRDASTTVTLRKIKGIFDPNNVMNPGKLCFV